MVVLISGGKPRRDHLYGASAAPRLGHVFDRVRLHGIAREPRRPRRQAVSLGDRVATAPSPPRVATRAATASLLPPSTASPRSILGAALRLGVAPRRRHHDLYLSLHHAG